MPTQVKMSPFSFILVTMFLLALQYLHTIYLVIDKKEILQGLIEQFSEDFWGNFTKDTSQ